ncbi:pilus assembly protein TadG-related protein [Serpentinicella sp. ANB-PHB4]|uniref:pilus assembly protein TadG-related protein n=1 Tax=Serpentinicella sp. ANB-PHB4 TaxID=3074076 RepID=UPI0028632CD1|nr:pilus assembly protein TadG-related protein [Serpentinicella sp. ANB-PHB4]MDR5658931.1 pilus assembly protein TadG-related protein [Serpentinicella sp. ANB-PHB4]
MKKINRILENEEGSALIIVAILMIVFIGFVALVVDAGLLYLNKFQITNATDSAALAAVQELPHNPYRAVEVGKSFGEKNGLHESTILIDIINNNHSVKVTTKRRVEFLFAKVLGFSTGQVEAVAIADVAPIVGLRGAVPLGVEDYDFTFGHQYTLKVGAGDGDTGWFGALALSKPGARIYEDNLTYGFDGVIRVGDILDVETGNMSNPTKRAIDYRIAQCNHIPYCTSDNFDPNCQRLLKVPVIEFKSHRQVEVLGFAIFLVDEVKGQGNESIITGKFIKTTISGEIDINGKDYGLYGTKLSY